MKRYKTLVSRIGHMKDDAITEAYIFKHCLAEQYLVIKSCDGKIDACYQTDTITEAETIAMKIVQGIPF